MMIRKVWTSPVTETPDHPAGWIVSVQLTSGLAYSYGDVQRGTGVPFSTESEAEQRAAKDRARIGCVEQHMMETSTMSIIMVRPASGESGKWIAALGVGSLTKSIKGAFSTPEEAECAAKDAIVVEWDRKIDHWKSVAEKAGIECRVTAVRPPSIVLLAKAGQPAWDALTEHRAKASA